MGLSGLEDDLEGLQGLDEEKTSPEPSPSNKML